MIDAEKQVKGSAKSRRGKPALRSARARLTGKAAALQDTWDEFTDQLPAKLQRANALFEEAKGRGQATPNNNPRALIKREVYRFVLELRERNRERYLEDVISVALEKLPVGIVFKENPFHWALAGVRATNDDLLTRNEVMRFGRQLIYAERHGVRPELLVGFVYQCGGPDIISEKASRPDCREEWWRPAVGEP